MAALLRALRQEHARPLPTHPTRPRLRRTSRVFNATDRAEAGRRLTDVLGRLEPIAPNVCELLEAAEEDLLAFMAFPPEHWTKLRSTNPLERVNREIGHRSDVVGIFPNDLSAIRLAGALLIEQNDEWIVCRRYLSEESMRVILCATMELDEPLSPDPKEEMNTLPTAARAATPCPTSSYTTTHDLTWPVRARPGPRPKAPTRVRLLGGRS